MKRTRHFYLVIGKKTLITIALCIPVIFASFLLLALLNGSKESFNDPGTDIIVIDPGHGGIDGGASSDGFLEKEINLSISQKLKTMLERNGFKVALTREKDESLENLSPDGGSRHQRDLAARAAIINSSKAELFLSIHVNSNVNNPNANGSVVYYGSRFEESPVLARCVQHSLNNIETESFKRDPHAIQEGKFYLLNTSEIPGVLIETAFITNRRERLLLATDEYRDSIAASIARGVLDYYENQGKTKPTKTNKPVTDNSIAGR